jgi:KDO2-lipid IV(A) lauroyltransferase
MAEQNNNSQSDFRKQQEQNNRGIDPVSRAKYFVIRNAIMWLGRIAAVLPEKVTYAACVRLTLVAHNRLPKFRRLARRHLEIAFGAEKTPEEIDDILRRTYINYGKSLAEFLMLPHKSKEWIESRVTLDDPNWYIRTEYEKGRGVVCLGGHFGSWELVAARIGIYKYPIVAVVKAQRDAIMTRFVMETRSKWGNEYIFRERGVKEECIRQLDRNKLLGLMADQNATRGVFVNFFGKPARTAAGPAEIAMKRKQPVIPAFPARNPDNTITLYTQKPIQMRDTGNYEEDLVHNLQQCSDAIEKFASEHPEEYFWWHRRWKSQKPAETGTKPGKPGADS